MTLLDTSTRLGRTFEQNLVQPLLHITMVQLWRSQSTILGNPLHRLNKLIREQLTLAKRYNEATSTYTPPKNPLLQFFDAGSTDRHTIKLALGNTHSRWLTAFNKSNGDAQLLEQMAKIVACFSSRIDSKDIGHTRGWHSLRTCHQEVTQALEDIRSSCAKGSIPHEVATALAKKVSDLSHVYTAFSIFEKKLKQRCIRTTGKISKLKVNYHGALGLLIALVPTTFISIFDKTLKELSGKASASPDTPLKLHFLLNGQTDISITNITKELLMHINTIPTLSALLLGHNEGHKATIMTWVGKHCNTPDEVEAFIRSTYPISFIKEDLRYLEKAYVETTPPSTQAPESDLVPFAAYPLTNAQQQAAASNRLLKLITEIAPDMPEATFFSPVLSISAVPAQAPLSQTRQEPPRPHKLLSLQIAGE
ncbi:MAG: hypothetical protein DHS20C10_05060 [marine bacterium B5-7]|nr:MAG: hypothetical protein DHS20C10_05060 [marine bacterium B5-7]